MTERRGKRRASPLVAALFASAALAAFSALFGLFLSTVVMWGGFAFASVAKWKWAGHRNENSRFTLLLAAVGTATWLAAATDLVAGTPRIAVPISMAVVATILVLGGIRGYKYFARAQDDQ